MNFSMANLDFHVNILKLQEPKVLCPIVPNPIFIILTKETTKNKKRFQDTQTKLTQKKYPTLNYLRFQEI